MNGWVLSSLKKSLRPLIAESDFIWCYSAGEFCRVNYELDIIDNVVQIPEVSRLGRLGRKIRFLERIFRLSPSHAIRIGDSIYIARRSEIFLLDVVNGTLVTDFIIPDARRALHFGVVKGRDGEERVVFGEYFNNPRRTAVRIWGRSSRSGLWEVLNEFPTGEIEHVHSIVVVNGKVLVLCGDFDDCASIWESDGDFSFLKPVLRGNQSCRAAWMAQIGERLIYATDSQLEENHLRELHLGHVSAYSCEIQSIEGSSIYCGSGPENHFFSTTVEGGLPTGILVVDLLDCRRGPGINSRYSKILNINSNMSCEEVYRAKKDLWPFRLGQFGTFIFPSGVQPDGLIVAYAVALDGIDDACLVFRKI